MSFHPNADSIRVGNANFQMDDNVADVDATAWEWAWTSASPSATAIVLANDQK
jgi:hypothetical protein